MMNRWIDKVFPAAMTLALLSTTAVAQQSPYNPFGNRSGDGGNQPSAGLVTSAEFVNAPLGNVVRVVSDLTGWSIILSPAVIAKKPTVSLWIKGMRPEEVLRQVVNLSGLVLHHEQGAYHIMTFEEYAKLQGIERHVRQLQHVSAADVVTVLKKFIGEEDAAKVVSAQVGNKVVLLAPQPQMNALQHLIDAIDVPFKRGRIEVVHLEYLEASAVVPRLKEFFTQPVGPGERGGAVLREPVSVAPAREGAPAAPAQDEAPAAAVPDAAASEEGAGGGGKAGERLLVQFMIEPKLNAVVIRGLPGDVQRVLDLLERLDVPPDVEVVSYQLHYTNAAQVRETLDQLLEESRRGGRGRGSASFGLPRVAVSESNNRVIVEGSPEAQKRMAAIIRAIDQPLPAGAGAIRVYRLDNASAKEVTEVLKSILLEDDQEEAKASVESSEKVQRYGSLDLSGSAETGATPPAPAPPVAPASPGEVGTAVPLVSVNAVPPRVTAAPQINAVVIRASAAQHEALEQVIAELDRPRPQVLIQVTLVSVTATENFSLGVEIGGSLEVRGTDIIGFSTFGIGAVNPMTGILQIAEPSPFGANLAIINEDDISLVLNALRTVGDTRVMSAPKVLVEDNAPATIRQLNQQPFEVLSQGETSTISSFGGYVKAGTVLKVVPHVSQDGWVRLEYEVSLSSFGTRTAEQLAANLPPPRTTNESEGTVRVPSGRVVVLGGLTTSRDSELVDKVPLLADIPLLGELFKNRNESERKNTLFIFIRPVVLGEPGFRDLVLLSKEAISQAGIEKDGFPDNPLKFFGPPYQTLEENKP